MNAYAAYHILGILILLCCSFFFSCTETTLFSLTGYQTKRLQRDHPRRGALVAGLLANPRNLLITILIGNMFVNISSSVLGESLMRRLIPGGAGTFAAILIMSFCILVVGEITPKTIAIRWNRRLAPLVAPLIAAIAKAESPLRWAVRSVSDGISSLFSRHILPTEYAVTEAEIRTAIRIGSREGVVDPQEKKMLQGVFTFAGRRAGDLMRPRGAIVACELRAPLAAAAELFREHGYSRIPVYEGTLDDVRGILYAKDLFDALREGGRETPGGLLRPAFIVPESKTASSILQEFRTRRTRIAIVADEHGGVAGLLTLADLFADIIGEVRDKGENAPLFRKREGGAVGVEGRMGIGEFNRLFGCTISARRNSTIGGYLAGRIGKIPPEGYRMRHGALIIEITAADSHRIREIAVRRESGS